MKGLSPQMRERERVGLNEVRHDRSRRIGTFLFDFIFSGSVLYYENWICLRYFIEDLLIIVLYSSIWQIGKCQTCHVCAQNANIFPEKYDSFSS